MNPFLEKTSGKNSAVFLDQIVKRYFYFLWHFLESYLLFFQKHKTRKKAKGLIISRTFSLIQESAISTSWLNFWWSLASSNLLPLLADASSSSSQWRYSASMRRSTSSAAKCPDVISSSPVSRTASMASSWAVSSASKAWCFWSLLSKFAGSL